MQYHKLIPMLLNELQNQERQIAELMGRLEMLESDGEREMVQMK